jgi:glycosyltransferase involved in cell wall biosynthesis
VSADLSVVLPVYRTREALPELHRRLRASTDGLGRVELVFVNDACPDGSVEALRAICERDPLARMVNLPERQGQHEALCAGLIVANGNIVIIMDATQDPPEAIRHGGVAATRLRRGVRVQARPHQSSGRLWSSWIFKRAVTRFPVPADVGSLWR